MPFSYNEDLVLESNSRLMTTLRQIPEETILHTLREIVFREVSWNRLQEEFVAGWRELYSKPITGENIKNYFVIVLNGIKKVWEAIIKKFPQLFNDNQEALHEDVLEYLEGLLDCINFDRAYEKELNCLNA